MKITVVKPDAMIQATSYCRKLPDGSEQDISYYEVADTIEIDLDKLLKDFGVTSAKRQGIEYSIQSKLEA